MSTQTSKEQRYTCYNEVHGQSVPCPEGGHSLQIEIHNTSDTVSICVDGKSKYCMDHGEYVALVEAIKELESRP